MALTPKRLYTGVLTTGSLASLLTPSSVKHCVRTIDLHNVTGGDVVVTLAEYVSTTDYNFVEYTMGTKDNLTLSYEAPGRVIESGQILKGGADTASSINCSIFGTEVS